MGLPLAVVQAIQIIGAVVAVAGTVDSIQQGKKARRAQKEQNRKVRASNAAKAAAARRRANREERVRSAQLASQAEAGGFTGGSTAILGQGMSKSITASKASGISNSLSTTNILSKGNQAIQDANDRQALASQIASIGTTVFGAASAMSADATGGGMFDNSKETKGFSSFSKGVQAQGVLNR
jgi:hypothetical protein